MNSDIRISALHRRMPLVAVMSCALLVTACATGGSTSVTPQVSAPSVTEARIIDSSKRVAVALESLQRAQAVQSADAGHPIPPAVDPTSAPEPLRMQVTWVDWKGPIEQAVRGLAERIGWRVRVNGVSPPTPVIVHVDAHELPAIRILEDVGLQAGSRAMVRLDATTDTVHLYYAPPMTGMK